MKVITSSIFHNYGTAQMGNSGHTNSKNVYFSIYYGTYVFFFTFFTYINHYMKNINSISPYMSPR